MRKNLLLFIGGIDPSGVILLCAVIILILVILLVRLKNRKDRLVLEQRQQLAGKNEQLAEQTRQLAEQAETLASQLRQLQDLDAAKKHFLTQASHELRTPLTLLIGTLSDKIRSLTDPTDVAFRWDEVVTMHRNAQRLLQVVNQLLDVQDIDSGKVETTLTPGIELESLTSITTGTAQAVDMPRRPTVLIVEDNDDLRMFIRNQLQRNYRVLESENGVRGLEIAFSNMPDLVISDWMMPEMNGTELCRRLKTDERTRHIPVMLLTALVTPDHKQTGLETGADDYLSKPFDPRELLARVQNLLEKQREKPDQREPIDPIDPATATVE